MRFIALVFAAAVFMLSVPAAQAQLESANWYFGNNAAVSFVSGVPVNLPAGALSTTEGCSSISDGAGNLLFYTDGTYVYNANHVQMPNGFGLNGDPSSTQSAVIIQDPAAAGLYYIFTIDVTGGSDGLCYSKVDMSLNGGLGDVTVLNVPLVAPTNEKVTAVANADGTGYWVLTRKDPNLFYAFPLTASGVGTPVISNGVLTDNAGIGHLKISPDGQHIASCHHQGQKVEIADFNNATGVVSNPFTFNSTGANTYAAEFSNSGNVLYIGSYSTLYQLNMNAGSAADIVASAQVIFTGSVVTNPGALQMATDGKIYRAQYGHSFLGVINQPEVLGTGCNYVDNAFTLNNGCTLGLPNSLSGPVTPPVSLSIQGDLNLCQGDTTTLNAIGEGPVWWSTLDNPGVQIDNDSILIINPAFTTTYIAHGPSVNDTATVVVTPLPTVNAGDDLVLCNDETADLNVFCDSCTYQWHDGSTAATFVAGAAGLYSVTVTNAAGCAADDSVNVDVSSISVSLISDTSICDGTSFLLVPESSAPAAFQWQDGSVDSVFAVNAAGVYSVVATDAFGCTATDATDVEVISVTVDLGDDVSVCNGDQAVISAGSGFDSYLWSEGSTTASISTGSAGLYTVTVSLQECTAYDSVNVALITIPSVSLDADTTLCIPNELILDAGFNDSGWLWSTGATTQSIGVNTTGVYWVRAGRDGCFDYDSMTVTFVSCDLYVPNAFSPNNDGLNDVFRAAYYFYPDDFELKVFNRWGELLYSGSDPQHGWDGTFRNHACDIGSYVWICDYRIEGRHGQKQGSVTLMR